jgi:hypothetical protein
LAPNIFEPPFTIATSITFLSSNGKGLMVYEPTTISIVEVPNGLAIIQPKEKKKANEKHFWNKWNHYFSGVKI